MFARFSMVDVQSQLSFGDLLQGSVGQQHHGLALSLAKRLWPRALIRNSLSGYGLFLLIKASK